jgi:hypothetical protein
MAAGNGLSATLSVVSLENSNLSEPEKELLLRWHFRLGHLGFRKMQFLMRTGVLATPSQATRHMHTVTSKRSVPPRKCAACQYGKQTCRPTPGKTSSVDCDHAGVWLKKDHLNTGQEVTLDHFVCSTKGRLLFLKERQVMMKCFLGVGVCLLITPPATFTWSFRLTSTLRRLSKRKKIRAHVSRGQHGVIPQAYLSPLTMDPPSHQNSLSPSHEIRGCWRSPSQCKCRACHPNYNEECFANHDAARCYPLA